MHFQKAMFYKRHYCSYIQSLLYYFMYIIIYIILYCSYVMFLYSVLNIHWKDWCWSWSSYTLATWCEELTHWKRPWCWKRWKAGGEGDDRRWDGWMASLTRWTWFWASSRNWWWTGRLACCCPYSGEESDTTEWLNWTDCSFWWFKLWSDLIIGGL